MSELQRAAAGVVDRYLAALEGETRRVADREWGLTVDAAGWPLHVGVAIREGLLRAQAEVVGVGQIDPHSLLHWNRGLPHARFTETGAGDVWLEADMDLEAVTPERLDGFLGLVVRLATQARERAGVRPL
jgi:Putative bacterial sensory transduction regulator